MDDSPGQWWLGLVVPKRHARRAVTRSLIKRLMRSAMADAVACAPDAPVLLPPGLWVLRLRAPFDRARFVSAASVVLREAVRSELKLLLHRAAAAAAVPSR